MKRPSIFVVCVVVLTLFAIQAFAQYDSEAVKKVMQAHVKLLGEISKAVEDKDFFTAAEKLMENAKLFKSLENMPSRQGSEEEWKRIIAGMIKASFKGIGACGEENADGVKAALAELNKYKGEGHGMFR